MDGQRSPAAFGRIDLTLIFLLLLVAGGLRSWQLAHAEVAARDSIGYIRIAWQLRHAIKELRDPAKHDGDWPGVIRKAPQHPGYPVALLLVSVPMRHLYNDDLPLAMQRSAQLTSVLASILVVMPMFLLGRGLFGRRAGFVAALLFQCLPTSGRLMADGVSEPLFLLFVCTALLAAHYGLRRGSSWWFAVTGLSGGLAYLTRPEGALVVAATGLVLVALQAFAAWRRPWRSFAKCGVLLAWGTLTVAGPFVLIVGHLTTKNTPAHVMDTSTAQLSPREQPEALVLTDVPAGPTATQLANEPKPLPAALALLLFVTTLGKSFYYVTWVPALLGLLLCRDRFRLAPVSWVLLLVVLALGISLYRVPVIMGYLSDRHMVLILFVGTLWAAAGLLRGGNAIADWCATRSAAWGRKDGMWGRRPFWAALLLLPIIAAALVKTLEPLHADRVPYRDAGHWLAQNAAPNADIDDPYCWAAYYAGRTLPGDDAPVKPAAPQPRVCYVVVEKGQRLPPVTDPKKFQDLQPVQTWPVQHGKQQSEVAVYEVPE